MQQEGGELLCIELYYIFALTCGILTNKIKLKLKKQEIKRDKDFTWKPSWPNKKEKPRPPGFQNSHYVLGNQLQLHKTVCFT